MTTQIRAIETQYAGCRFRSRLEARWAVFFDHMGIRWEYEPQGFEVTWRLSNYDETFRYLPDFWLPDHGLWAEVKGSLNEDEGFRLLNAAASISSNNGGGCHDDGGNDVLLLGSIPRPDKHEVVSPWVMHLHKGDLEVFQWDPSVIYPNPGRHQHATSTRGRTIAYDVGDGWRGITWPSVWPRHEILDRLLAGGPISSKHRSRFNGAYAAARSARFEHGESG